MGALDLTRPSIFTGIRCLLHGFVALSEIGTELGRCAHAMIEYGVIDVYAADLVGIGWELSPHVLDPKDRQAGLVVETSGNVLGERSFDAWQLRHPERYINLPFVTALWLVIEGKEEALIRRFRRREGTLLIEVADQFHAGMLEQWREDRKHPVNAQAGERTLKSRSRQTMRPETKLPTRETVPACPNMGYIQVSDDMPCLSLKQQLLADEFGGGARAQMFTRWICLHACLPVVDCSFIEKLPYDTEPTSVVADLPRYCDVGRLRSITSPSQFI